MRRNTDIELPKCRVMIHVICETYARAQTSDHKSHLLDELEKIIFHAADLLAWDIVDAQNGGLTSFDTRSLEDATHDQGADARTLAA